MNFRVALTDPDLHPPSKELEAELARCGARLEARVCATEGELCDWCAGADALLCARAAITRRVVLAMPACRIIARLGTGYDNIDVEAAGQAGIPVTNVPDFCTQEVADHTLALLLACSRKLVAMAQDTRRGLWRPDAVMHAHRLSGKTIGLVGFGRIGRAVAERALAFGLRVVFFDPVCQGSGNSRFESCPTLAALFRQSDIVSLHLPLNERTRGLIGQQAFEQMKPGTIFINCARGAVVIEADLVQALRSGCLAAAGLDTLAVEPPAPGNPLLGLSNVIVTPHCAAHTIEALADLREQAYAEVCRALRGEPLFHVVNQEYLTPTASRLRV